MDLSEFKIMEDNKRLLEESLKREKEQNAKIESFNQEKIDILKSNEKSVTIIKRTERTDLIRPKVKSNLILNRLQAGFNNRRNSMDYKTDLDRLQAGFNNRRNSMDYKTDLDIIIDSCFEILKSESFPPEEEVVIKGLEDVKADLRSEIIKDFEKQINNLNNKVKSLKDLNELLESNSLVTKQQLLDTNDSLKSAEKDIFKLAVENIEYEEYTEALELQLENYNKIKKLSNNKVNIFNFIGFVKKVKNLLL